jgi:hypothetical protein
MNYAAASLRFRVLWSLRRGSLRLHALPFAHNPRAAGQGREDIKVRNTFPVVTHAVRRCSQSLAIRRDLTMRDRAVGNTRGECIANAPFASGLFFPWIYRVGASCARC